MLLGEKIKRIRVFRGMKQRDLGLSVGFSEQTADNRIAQYETNYRVPKRDILLKMAETLNVNPLNFVSEAPGSAEDIMQTFFWLDESNRGAINLFQLATYDGYVADPEDKLVRYNDSDNWPAHSPVGMYFKYGAVDRFMREWLLRKEELKAGEISQDEYFEWKLNWPQSCDNCGNCTPTKLWRK